MQVSIAARRPLSTGQTVLTGRLARSRIVDQRFHASLPGQGSVFARSRLTAILATGDSAAPRTIKRVASEKTSRSAPTTSRGARDGR